jgi:hypothetical protein
MVSVPGAVAALNPQVPAALVEPFATVDPPRLLELDSKELFTITTFCASAVAAITESRII